MKIVSADILQLGEGGVRVNVTFHWQHNEQFDMNDVGGVLAWLQLHGLCGEGCGPQSRNVEVTAEEKAALLEKHRAVTAEDDKRNSIMAEEKAMLLRGETVGAVTRRRKRNPLEVAGAGAAPLPSADAATSAPEEAPAAASVSEPSTTRRRRAPSTEAPVSTGDTSSPPSPSSEGDAAPLRRRRAAPAAEGTPATTAPAPETAASPEPGTRRRRAAPSAAPEPATVEPVKETAPAPAASEPSAITDADMAKAASRGAAALTPNVVKAFIATFLKDDDTPCERVNDIHADDRRAFIDELNAKIEAAQ